MSQLTESGSFLNISTQATFVLKTGGTMLKRIILNTQVASGVITVYDNTAGSGTKIATITLPATLLNDGPTSVDYGVSCKTGLTVVTSGANADWTVVYE